MLMQAPAGIWALINVYFPVPESRLPAGGDAIAEDWGFLVKQCVGHLIVLVGLVGNCLSFVVMKSKSLRNKSYSHYLWSVVCIQRVGICLIGLSILITLTSLRR